MYREWRKNESVMERQSSRLGLEWPHHIASQKHERLQWTTEGRVNERGRQVGKITAIKAETCLQEDGDGSYTGKVDTCEWVLNVRERLKWGLCERWLVGLARQQCVWRPFPGWGRKPWRAGAQAECARLKVTCKDRVEQREEETQGFLVIFHHDLNNGNRYRRTICYCSL